MTLPKKQNPYTQVSSEEIPCRNYLTFFKDQVRINHLEKDYSYPRISDSICIVALNEKNDVCLVGQWRYPIGAYTWEMPTGTRKEGAPLLDTAKRELREETGLTAEKWTALGSYTAAGSVVKLTKHLFLAQNLVAGAQDLAPDEAIETLWLPFGEVLKLTETGEIHDAASTLALLKTARLLEL